jgi:hypothetical protein
VIADDGAVIASFGTNAAAWDFVDRRNHENRSPKEQLAALMWRTALNRWSWLDRHY